MSINWNFGDQRAIETKSTFTKDADAAFDEFCKTYLNSSNGFFMSTPVTTPMSLNDSTFSNLDMFISSLSNSTTPATLTGAHQNSLKNYSTSSRTYLFEQSAQDAFNLASNSQKSKSAKSSISFRDSLSYFKEDALLRSQLSLAQNSSKDLNDENVNYNRSKKSIDNLFNINEAINKLSIDSLQSASATSINNASSKASENVNFRLKHSRNRPKRRSIENLMETFEEFSKTNSKFTQQHPTLVEEITATPSNTNSNRPSIELDKSTSSKEKDAYFKSLKMKSNHHETKSDTRPKSFYGYPNNFYIEKYLESSYKTIDIIDHLNDFNKNYDRINKEKNKGLESDFSAINNYEELKLNEEYTSTNTNVIKNDDAVKTKILSNTELLNQLNNINQLQLEKQNQQSIVVINATSVNSNNTNNDELNSINNRNLLENEVNKTNSSSSSSSSNHSNNETSQQTVQMDTFSSYLNDSRVYIVNSNGASNSLSNQTANADGDYNRASFHEASATGGELRESTTELPQQQFSFLSEFRTSQDTRYQKPSCLFETNFDQLVLDIPKKKSFSEEFFKPKQQNLSRPQQFGHVLSGYNATYSVDVNSKTNNKENDSFISDYISSYIAVPPTLKMEKPEGWLGFKVIACGLKKNGELPIPKPNYFVDRGDFGDDAGFFSENVYGDAIGVADGATGNCMLGYDPGDFSRNLMQLCSEIFVRENLMYDAKTLLLKAYDAVQDKTCYGSCTACVLTLSHHNNVMTAANVGDTGYCVLRNSKIVHKSIPQRISYECPRQLDSYPWKEKSRKMGVSYTEILGNDTICEQFKVQKDDIIIVSSDGLYDNLEFDEIERIYLKSKNDYDAIKNLVFNSVKFYRKPDDILVLIAKVVDNKPACIQQKFTKDPYAPL